MIKKKPCFERKNKQIRDYVEKNKSKVISVLVARFKSDFLTIDFFSKLDFDIKTL